MRKYKPYYNYLQQKISTGMHDYFGKIYLHMSIDPARQKILKQIAWQKEKKKQK